MATVPHLHVASLRSLYLKHTEFIVWLGREREHSCQQQKGVLGSRLAESGRLSRAEAWQAPGKYCLQSLTFPLWMEAQVSAAVREAALWYEETESTLFSFNHMLWLVAQLRVKGQPGLQPLFQGD